MIGFRENDIFSDTPIEAICKDDEPLKSFIENEKDCRQFPVDSTSSGLTPSA